LYEREIFYSILYIVIFPSILSFYFWNISTKVLSANITGQFTHLMPLFGAVMAFFLLGEILYIYHYIGIFLIAIGIYFSTFFKKK
jgi:drug/metabolite transporter (DMT)-like permease